MRHIRSGFLAVHGQISDVVKHEVAQRVVLNVLGTEFLEQLRGAHPVAEADVAGERKHAKLKVFARGFKAALGKRSRAKQKACPLSTRRRKCSVKERVGGEQQKIVAVLALRGLEADAQRQGSAIRRHELRSARLIGRRRQRIGREKEAVDLLGARLTTHNRDAVLALGRLGRQGGREGLAAGGGNERKERTNVAEKAKFGAKKTKVLFDPRLDLVLGGAALGDRNTTQQLHGGEARPADGRRGLNDRRDERVRLLDGRVGPGRVVALDVFAADDGKERVKVGREERPVVAALGKDQRARRRIGATEVTQLEKQRDAQRQTIRLDLVDLGAERAVDEREHAGDIRALLEHLQVQLELFQALHLAFLGGLFNHLFGKHERELGSGGTAGGLRLEKDACDSPKEVALLAVRLVQAHGELLLAAEKVPARGAHKRVGEVVLGAAGCRIRRGLVHVANVLKAAQGTQRLCQHLKGSVVRDLARAQRIDNLKSFVAALQALQRRRLESLRDRVSRSTRDETYVPGSEAPFRPFSKPCCTPAAPACSPCCPAVLCNIPLSDDNISAQWPYHRWAARGAPPSGPPWR